ncbi:fatty acid synthase alpha subunit Lsd1, partial [Coemansia erecta]
GPVAVRYSTRANEPVKDILDGIYHGQIAKLLEQQYDNEQSRVSDIEYLGGGENLLLGNKTRIEPVDSKSLTEGTR